MAVEDTQQEAPPVGEEVHLSGPTILPLMTAAATTIALVGLTTTWVLTIAGVIVLVVCIWRWIGDTRREISELPLERD